MAEADYPVEDISPTSIQDKWLRGMMEECDARGVVYHTKQHTTPTWGTQQFLEIPKLKATVGVELMGNGQLMLSPDEAPWDMQTATSFAYGPRGLAEMVIRKRLRELGE